MSQHDTLKINGNLEIVNDVTVEGAVEVKENLTIKDNLQINEGNIGLVGNESTKFKIGEVTEKNDEGETVTTVVVGMESTHINDSSVYCRSDGKTIIKGKEKIQLEGQTNKLVYVNNSGAGDKRASLTCSFGVTDGTKARKISGATTSVKYNLRYYEVPGYMGTNSSSLYHIIGNLLVSSDSGLSNNIWFDFNALYPLIIDNDGVISVQLTQSAYGGGLSAITLEAWPIYFKSENEATDSKSYPYTVLIRGYNPDKNTGDDRRRWENGDRFFIDMYAMGHQNLQN